MRPILELVRQHGGIARVVTSTVPQFDRSSGATIRRWANRIECRDGWTAVLSPEEEAALKELPEGLLAEDHLIEGPSG